MKISTQAKSTVPDVRIPNVYLHAEDRRLQHWAADTRMRDTLFECGWVNAVPLSGDVALLKKRVDDALYVCDLEGAIRVEMLLQIDSAPERPAASTDDEAGPDIKLPQSTESP